jgi:uncharacterized protein YkwD
MARGPGIVALLGSAALLAAPVALAHSGAREATLEQGVLERINAVRHDHGLRPLRLSAQLTAAAAQHTEEMGEDGYFAHESAGHASLGPRLRRWYPVLHGSWAVGENLLWSSPSIGAAGAVATWLGSPAHRANLLGPAWRDIGLSVVHFDSAPGAFGGRPVTIITVDFGARG